MCLCAPFIAAGQKEEHSNSSLIKLTVNQWFMTGWKAHTQLMTKSHTIYLCIQLSYNLWHLLKPPWSNYRSLNCTWTALILIMELCVCMCVFVCVHAHVYTCSHWNSKGNLVSSELEQCHFFWGNAVWLWMLYNKMLCNAIKALLSKV